MHKCIVFFGLILIVLNSKAQIPQMNCTRLPSRNELVDRLKEKPIIQLNSWDFYMGCNVDDTIKKRLLYLLNWEWTEAEIENYLVRKIGNHQGKYGVDFDANQIAKGNDSVFRKAKDSIIKSERKRYYRYLEDVNFEGVDGMLMLTVAKLNYTEAIPILRKGLSLQMYYNPHFVELALARLGDTALQRKIIATGEYIPYLEEDQWIDHFEKIARNLAFIQTQESIFQIGCWLDSTKIWYPTSSPNIRYKCACNVILYLAYLIQDEEFQAIVEPYNFDDAPHKVTNEMISAAKTWLTVNKGKYKINRKFCSY
jgi:hypothetical protein